MGEKDYLYKNSLWQESTQVPLIVRAPGIAKAGGVAEQPVSLIDLYPTLIDLCGLTGETKKNDKGRPLDGHSLRPFLENPQTDEWSGPDEVLTALYKWAMFYDPAEQSYSLRSKDWRYIRYSNGKEELYHNAEDPYEWTNLAGNPQYASKLESFRAKLDARLPEPESGPAKSADESGRTISSGSTRRPTPTRTARYPGRNTKLTRPSSMRKKAAEVKKVASSHRQMELSWQSKLALVHAGTVSSPVVCRVPCMADGQAGAISRRNLGDHLRPRERGPRGRLASGRRVLANSDRFARFKCPVAGS